MTNVKKTEYKNKEKENLYNELVMNFTTSFRKIVEDYKDNTFFTGNEKKQIDIARDLEISEQALINYQTNRIPTKLLPVIRNYFDVPYSTLFGEITNKNLDNAKIGLKIGLTDKSIEKLEKIQKNAMKDDFSTNYENKFKLFLINSIICDDDLIDNLSSTFSYYLGQIKIKEKLKNSKFVIKSPKDDYYYIHLYRFISSIETRFDKLAHSEDVTPQIENMAYIIRKKYAGEYQKYLKEIDKDYSK